MTEFKVGDRVRVYGYHDETMKPLEAEIFFIRKSGWLEVSNSKVNIVAHPKACRRLVKKERPIVFVHYVEFGPGLQVHGGAKCAYPTCREFREVKRT